MKIHIDLPLGGEFHYERKKMDWEISALLAFIIPLTAMIAFVFR